MATERLQLLFRSLCLVKNCATPWGKGQDTRERGLRQARYRVVFLEMFGKDFPKLNLVREAEANEREDQKMRQNEGEKCNIDNILEARGDIKENNSLIAPTRQQDYRPAASDLINNRVEWDERSGTTSVHALNANVYRKRTGKAWSFWMTSMQSRFKALI